MRTTILAYVIALIGLATIALGVWAFYFLLTETQYEVPLSDFGIAIGMISGGFGLIGLAQAVRLLAEILTRGAKYIKLTTGLS
jgi:hypothetical protein